MPLPALAIPVAMTGAQVALGVGAKIAGHRKKKKKQQKQTTHEGDDAKGGKEGEGGGGFGGGSYGAGRGVGGGNYGAGRGVRGGSYGAGREPPRPRRLSTLERRQNYRGRRGGESYEAEREPPRSIRRAARSDELIDYHFSNLVQESLGDLVGSIILKNFSQDSAPQNCHSPYGPNYLNSTWNGVNPPPCDHDLRCRGQSLYPYATSQYRQPCTSCHHTLPFADTYGIDFATPSHSHDLRQSIGASNQPSPFSMNSDWSECQNCRIFHAHGHRFPP